MRYLLFTAISVLLTTSACRESKDSASPCLEITPNVAFTAKVHDTWCLSDESVKITFASIIEDGRCNVDNIECVWAGQAVIELQITTNEISTYLDTLYAIDNWQGQIPVGGRTLKLQHISPDTRATMAVDTTTYRFEMVLQ